MGGVLAKRVIKNLHALMSNHGGFWPACAIFKVVCIARIVSVATFALNGMKLRIMTVLLVGLIVFTFIFSYLLQFA